MTGNAASWTKPTGNAVRRPAWMWYVVIAGYFLPSLIGIVVWLQLRSAGKPVMSTEWIVGIVPVLCIVSLIWDLPFLLVLLVAGYVDLHQKKIKGMMFGAFIGTVLAEIVVFGDAWQNVEVVAMGFLLLPIAVFVGTIVSGAVGFVIGWLLEHKFA